MNKWEVIEGDCLEVMAGMAAGNHLFAEGSEGN